MKKEGERTMDRLRKKGLKLTGMLAGITLAVISLSGCGKGKAAEEVHIGYFNNVTHAQALYMKAEGTLDGGFGEEVPVTWTAFNAGPSEVEALFSGDIDLGYIGPVPAITANVKSEGDILVLSGATMAGAELVKAGGSDITSVADLDGKTVAVPQIGNTQHLCLLKLLSDNGLSPVEAGGTVNVTAVENADVQNMMDQGNIDAALVPEPWGTTLVQGGAEIVLDYDEVYAEGDYPVAVVVVRKDFLEENPEMVSAFLKAHEETTDYIAENTQEAAAVINEEINEATGKSLEESVLQSAFEKILVSSEVNEEAMKEFGEISLEQEFIAKNYEHLFAEEALQ